MQCVCGITKKIVNNEKGIALISALLLGLLGMLMVTSLLVMIDTGTWLSGSKKRYQMALEAAHGGMNFFTKEIIQKGLGGTDLSDMGTTFGGLLTPVISNANFTTKLTTSGETKDGYWPYDPNATNTAVAFDATDATVALTLPTGLNIAVNTTILSTSRGNSGTSSNLLQGGGVVNNNSGTITPQHIPYLYQTGTRGQNTTNPIENATLSSIYAY